MSKTVMRLVAAAIGAALVALLAFGGVAAYRAIVRFNDPLSPEPGLV
ncbi:MAG: dipeptidyl aminopeptidase, partial [Planctomycetes bacterium]|nr:dipeptidyl aminopeptidase [Planctomycetota bacterium]